MASTRRVVSQQSQRARQRAPPGHGRVAGRGTEREGWQIQPSARLQSHPQLPVPRPVPHKPARSAGLGAFPQEDLTWLSPCSILTSGTQLLFIYSARIVENTQAPGTACWAL